MTVEQELKIQYRIGRENGQEETQIAIAKNLIDMGMPIEQIAKVTGLTIEEIEEL